MARGAAAIGLATFAFHALTAASGLFWLDAGDFVTASADLGVPHPTGFPLFVLLGKLCALLPLGPAAFKVTLVPALAAGLATGLVAWLAAALAPPDRRLWALVLAATASAVLWSTDVAALFGRTADVYSLHAALVLAALAVCLPLWREDRLRDWLSLGLIVGLGLSNHAEYRLFAPIFLGMAATATLGRGRRRLRRLAGRTGLWLAGVVVGLLPYLYLPLAAGRPPYHAWGQPHTWARFVDHITGLTIRVGFRDELLNLASARLEAHARVFVEQVASGFGTLLIVVPIGLVWMARRRLRAALTVLALLVVDAGYAIAVNPMGLVDLQNGATTWVLLALLIALGFVALTELIRHHVTARGDRALMAPLVALALAVAILETDPQRVVLNGTWGAEDLAFEALRTPPQGSLVLTGSEAFGAAQLYLIGVGALRPDEQVLHMSDVTEASTLLVRHQRGAFALAGDEEVARWARSGHGASDATFQRRLHALLDHAFGEGRAVFWGPGAESEAAGLWDHLELGFPLHRLFRDRVTTGALPLGFAPPAWEGLANDPWGNRWLAQYWNWAGTYLFHRNAPDAATAAFGKAAALYPDWSAPLVNLGVLAALRADLERARDLAADALEVDPLNLTAWLNLSRYACQLGDAGEAAAALAGARRLDVRTDRLAPVADFIAHCPPRDAPPPSE